MLQHNTLFDSACEKLFYSNPNVDISPFPPSVKRRITKVRSTFDFHLRFIGAGSLPKRCFAYKPNGRLDVEGTLRNTTSVLHPTEMFIYYCATGMLDKLPAAWEECHGNGQDVLLAHPCEVIQHYAGLYLATDEDRLDQYEPLLTQEAIFRDARSHLWLPLALHAYKAIVNIASKKECLKVQWMSTVKTEHPYKRYLDCELLEELIALKDVKLCRCDFTEDEIRRIREIHKNGVPDLPDSSTIQADTSLLVDTPLRNTKKGFVQTIIADLAGLADVMGEVRDFLIQIVG